MIKVSGNANHSVTGGKLKVQLLKDLVRLADQVAHQATVEYRQIVLHQWVNSSWEASVVGKRTVVRIDLVFV
jgi:hypothetical protein